MDISLSAGRMTLRKHQTSDCLTLTVDYNGYTKEKIEVRGNDELYALKYLVDRAVAKIERAE